MFVLSIVLAMTPVAQFSAKTIVHDELRAVLRQCRLLTVEVDSPATAEERASVDECKHIQLRGRRERCEDAGARRARRLWAERLERILDDQYLVSHKERLVELPEHTKGSSIAQGIYTCTDSGAGRVCKRVAEFPSEPGSLYLGFQDDLQHEDSSYDLTMDCTRFIASTLSASAGASYGSLIGFSASTALRSEASSRQGISIRAGVFSNVLYLPFQRDGEREDLAAWTTLARLYAEGKLDARTPYYMVKAWTGLVLHRNTLYGWNDSASAASNLTIDVNLQFAKLGVDGAVKGTRGAISGLRSATSTFYQQGSPAWELLPSPDAILARWNALPHEKRPINGDAFELAEEKPVVSLVHFGPVDNCANVVVLPSKELESDRTIEFRALRNSVPIAGRMCALQVEFAMRESPNERDDGVRRTATFDAAVKGTKLSTTYSVELRPQIVTAPVTGSTSFAYDPTSGWRISFKLRSQDPFELRRILAEQLSCRSGATELKEAFTFVSSTTSGQRDQQEIVVRLAQPYRRFRELSCFLTMPLEIKRGARTIQTTLWATLDLPQDTSSDTVLVDASLADIKSLIRPDALTVDGIAFEEWLHRREPLAQDLAVENAAIHKALGIAITASDYAPVLEVPRAALAARTDTGEP